MRSPAEEGEDLHTSVMLYVGTANRLCDHGHGNVNIGNGAYATWASAQQTWAWKRANVLCENRHCENATLWVV